MDTIIPPNTPQRQCVRCLETKSFTDFYPNPLNNDGIAHVCKTCVKLIQQKKIPGVREVREQERVQMGPRKRCQTCKELLDLTPENFSYLKKSPDGFSSRCKRCNKLQYQKSQETYRRLHPKSERDTLHKQCANCDETYLATTEYFYKKLDGLAAICKNCAKTKDKARYVSLVKPKPATKTCTQCGKILPFTEEFFYPCKSFKKYGLMAHCKGCHQDWRTEYEKNNYEITLRWTHDRRARKKNVPGTYTTQQIQDLLMRQKYKCYYCFTPFKKEGEKYIYHVDHTFPLSRVVGTGIPANDISYLVLACESCNLKKGNKFPWEWPEGGRLL